MRERIKVLSCQKEQLNTSSPYVGNSTQMNDAITGEAIPEVMLFIKKQTKHFKN
jgi:hypothetical protein